MRSDLSSATNASGVNDVRHARPALAGGERSRLTAIREAALDLFAANGFRTTTMADVGERAGIRGPSVYKHVESKYALLTDIMTGTMTSLLARQAEALESTDVISLQLRRVAEAHVRYHARHHREAFIGNREIGSLADHDRAIVLDLRKQYEGNLRSVIEDGIDAGVFTTASARLASYAILDMGMGVAAWFRADGELSEDLIAYAYGEMALRVVELSM